MSYPTTCPQCGGTLYPVVLGPDSAPWVCVVCRHAWWVAELSMAARAQYRPEVADFGHGASLVTLQSEVEAEQGLARARGTSCRVDQLSLVPAVGLRWLEGLRLDPAFRALVDAELQRKGG